MYFIVKEGVFSASQTETIKASQRFADSVPAVNPYLEKVIFLNSSWEVLHS